MNLRIVFIVLAFCSAVPAFATETLHWKRLPLAIALHVGQERVIFVDHEVRVGVPTDAGDHLRVQSAAGAVYLRASAPFDATRLQLQDVSGGGLILIDVTARPADDGAAALEPVRIVFDEDRAATSRDPETARDSTSGASRSTPTPVVLTRYAAQSLYAPLRTVESVPGIARVGLPRRLALDALLPGRSVSARALAAWRLDNEWVTAVLLTNQSAEVVTLDPRTLQGDFVAATFQHHTLGPSRDPTDTTVLYLVTRGHGLAESLLPVISSINAAPERAPSTRSQDGQP